MSNPSPAHQPAGTPTGGQFAPSARAEDRAVQLESPDGTADLDPVDADAQLPTDPMALVAALDAERARESAEVYALQYQADESLDKHVYYALEDAQTMSSEQEFRRYRLLANAVTGAAPSARGPYLVALIGQLDAERGWEADEVEALRDAADESEHQYDYTALENAEKEYSDHESVRYRLLAEAVIDAAGQAPQPIRAPRPTLDSTGFGYDRNAFAAMIAGLQKDTAALPDR